MDINGIETFEKVYENLIVIGHYRGKAIVRDELRQLYFIQCAENEAPIGDVMERRVLEPVEKLSREEQECIQEIYAGMKKVESNDE